MTEAEARETIEGAHRPLSEDELRKGRCRPGLLDRYVEAHRVLGRELPAELVRALSGR